jgi:hypothetical protein
MTPWLLILANGDHCFAVAAATIPTAGLGEDYACGLVGGLYGAFHSTDQPWTIFEQRSGNSEMILTPIAKAYF